MQCQGQMLCLYSYPDLAMRDCDPEVRPSQTISSENLSQVPANKTQIERLQFRSPHPPSKHTQGYVLHE